MFYPDITPDRQQAKAVEVQIRVQFYESTSTNSGGVGMVMQIV